MSGGILPAPDLTVQQAWYRNHKGEVELRTFRPIRLWFGSTAWHLETQYLVEVFDVDKCQTRDYAMAGFLTPWSKVGGQPDAP